MRLSCTLALKAIYFVFVIPEAAVDSQTIEDAGKRSSLMVSICLLLAEIPLDGTELLLVIWFFFLEIVLIGIEGEELFE